jgi:hypothetical protein
MDVYSSRHGHSAASKTKDGENSLDQETSEDESEDDSGEVSLICWHCWHRMYESTDSSHDEDSDQDGEYEDSDRDGEHEEYSPFLFST